MATIGVAIPSIPPRRQLLARALTSVLGQTRPADAISVVIDHERAGAGRARNRAWQALTTDYVAFLDDDDEFGPKHLELLEACALGADADLVFPHFDVVGGTDPFPSHFGRPWDPNDPRQTTITCLWRRSALESVRGFPEAVSGDVDGGGHRMGEDFLAVAALNGRGGRIVHLAERTWIWHHHSGNTSGRPDVW